MKRGREHPWLRFVSGCIAVLFIFCAVAASAAAQAAETVLLTGAGATFPYPLYSKWFYEFNKQYPTIKINYQSIGSGGGVKQITEKTVDFGASDAPMSDFEMTKLHHPLLNIPTVIGAVVLAYNVPEIGEGFKLNGSVIADIYRGEITKWDDAKIAALNTGMKLPAKEIVVIHRSDGSGTTFVFTDYLAKVDRAWKMKVGAGKSVSWPVGLGAKGNEGVSGMVKQMPYSIGYIELGYAMQNKIRFANVQNKAGTFVTPSIASASAAAAGVTIPPDFRVSITDPNGKDAYPISSFTYLLVYKKQEDVAKGKALTTFLHWALHDGQKLASPLFYSPLPPAVAERVIKDVSQIATAP